MLIDRMSRWLVVFGMGLALMLPTATQAQDQREITLIAQLAFEQIAQREAEAAAAEEARHQATLEEQSRLKAAYQQYRGDAHEWQKTKPPPLHLRLYPH